MICPAIATASRTSARKIQSWNAIWCAAIEASPKRVATAPARTNESISDVVRTKIHFPSESTRRASASRTARLARLEPPQHDDDERRAHPQLRDRRPPRRPRDPPVEAVDEEQLEEDVRDVAGDEDDERRAQVGDAAEVALRPECEERGREPDRGDAQVRDGEVRRLALSAHERDELRRERGHQRRDRDAEGEREPDRLRAEPARGLRLSRSAGARDLRGRPVLQEVEDREDAAEDGERDAERRELRPAEVADDRGVDEEVERLRRERAQRRKREAEDLAVVPGAQPHAVREASIVAS